MEDGLSNIIGSSEIELIRTFMEPARDHGIEIDDDRSRQGPLFEKKKGKLECNLDHPKVYEPITTKRWSICRVPAHVREVDEKAYDPKIVFVGPFHHKNPFLTAMETQKQRFLNRLLQRREIRKIDLDEAMKELEGKTREYYSQQFNDMDNNDFVQIISSPLFGNCKGSWSDKVPLVSQRNKEDSRCDNDVDPHSIIIMFSSEVMLEDKEVHLQYVTTQSDSLIERGYG